MRWFPNNICWFLDMLASFTAANIGSNRLVGVKPTCNERDINLVSTGQYQGLRGEFEVLYLIRFSFVAAQNFLRGDC